MKIEVPDMNLVKKYDIRGSFYSDYPALGLWEKDFSDKEYKQALTDLSEVKDKPLSLYVHFPFCPKQCYYCMCYSQITGSHEKVGKFLDYTAREIDMMSKFFKEKNFKPNFKTMHLGGGSPSFMNKQEFDYLEKNLSKLVDIKNLEEFAIEVDVRTVNPDMLKYYHKKGINRISLGVQDFDPSVQKAINRVQPIELVDRLMTPEIRKLFPKGFNFDMIYGMPLQNKQTFRKTIDEIKRLSPDRLGVCILGWRPDIFKHQKMINESDLPSLEESNMMNFEATQSLLDAGYEKIGIDFFSKPTDDLAIAKKEGTLYRSAMGYSRGFKDVIGFGPSGMNRILNYYFQKHYEIKDYYSDIDNNKFPILRGYKLSKDFEMRRDLMQHIICDNVIDFDKKGKEYKIDFKEYFKRELNSLNHLISDGIVKLTDKELQITPIGEYFHRHVCAAFDKLLQTGSGYQHARDSA